jgi:hypothetical protein
MALWIFILIDYVENDVEIEVEAEVDVEVEVERNKPNL